MITHVNAEATSSMWNDTNLSSPYPYTDKLTSSFTLIVFQTFKRTKRKMQIGHLSNIYPGKNQPIVYSRSLRI